MIHDATVEVTCDVPGCNSSVSIQLQAGARNSYLANDFDIEIQLGPEHWEVRDGKHYCEWCVEDGRLP